MKRLATKNPDQIEIVAAHKIPNDADARSQSGSGSYK